MCEKFLLLTQRFESQTLKKLEEVLNIPYTNELHGNQCDSILDTRAAARVLAQHYKRSVENLFPSEHRDVLVCGLEKVNASTCFFLHKYFNNSSDSRAFSSHVLFPEERRALVKQTVEMWRINHSARSWEQRPVNRGPNT